MIHHVVFIYLGAIYYHISGVDGNEFFLTYGCWINLTLGFVITIIATEIWIRLYAKFFAPKKASLRQDNVEKRLENSSSLTKLIL